MEFLFTEACYKVKMKEAKIRELIALVTNAVRNGALTKPQGASMKRHIRTHASSEGHILQMLRHLQNGFTFKESHDKAMKSVGR